MGGNFNLKLKCWAASCHGDSDECDGHANALRQRVGYIVFNMAISGAY